MLSRTLFQIKQYQKIIRKRKWRERGDFLRDSATANNISSSEQFEEYVRMVTGEAEPDDYDSDEETFGEVPEGISIKR